MRRRDALAALGFAAYVLIVCTFTGLLGVFVHTEAGAIRQRDAEHVLTYFQQTMQLKLHNEASPVSRLSSALEVDPDDESWLPRVANDLLEREEIAYVAYVRDETMAYAYPEDAFGDSVGADLANLVNEAALRAVRLGRKAVNQEDLLAAFELVIAGAEKKGSVLSEFEKKLVAYHEVGHAMVAYRQKHAEPVSKITIVPHTQGALGYTLHLPEEDKHLHTRDELLAQITVSMGGRVAEELVLHTMTNGAAQDIQDATGIARNMVAMFGMSDEFGMMALASRRSQYLDGGYGIDCAQDTAAAMDRAVRDLIDACYKKAVEILSHSREDMDKVVEYLLEKETITGAEMVAILEGRDPALADNFPDPDGKGTAVPPAEPVSDPIPLSGGEPQPPDGGGMEFGPEGKPKE